MAMGTRKQREKQDDIWIAHGELASAPAKASRASTQPRTESCVLALVQHCEA